MPERQKHTQEGRSDPKRPKVRSASIRKSAKDGTSFTPTEKRLRDRLMRQFSKQAKGYAVGVSEAFKANYDAIDWKKG